MPILYKLVDIYERGREYGFCFITVNTDKRFDVLIILDADKVESFFKGEPIDIYEDGLIHKIIVGWWHNDKYGNFTSFQAANKYITECLGNWIRMQPSTISTENPERVDLIRDVPVEFLIELLEYIIADKNPTPHSFKRAEMGGAGRRNNNKKMKQKKSNRKMKRQLDKALSSRMRSKKLSKMRSEKLSRKRSKKRL